MTGQPPLMKIDKIFNVRVYGILIEDEAVLVSDEIHFDRMITKFPEADSNSEKAQRIV
jgi:hypothetical protein